MKKNILTILSILVLSSSINMAYSKTSVSSDLSNAIKLYKAGNYTECYLKLDNIIKKDPSNALAYYYMGMTSAQIGKNSEALENYEKAITLSPESSNLNRYAKKGKFCIEDPAKCSEYTYGNKDDAFILGKKNISDKAKSEFERLRIENMMREINRSDEVDPQKFKEYKDFSSMNPEGTPTNEEIVAALKTLQRAGLGDLFNQSSDISMFMNDTNYEQQAMLNLMGQSFVSPQMIQAMFTNNMSLGF